MTSASKYNDVCRRLTDSRKRVKTLGDNRTRKSHQPIETLN